MTKEFKKEDKEEIEKLLKDKKAVVTSDHFVYQSEKHGDAYVNKDAVYPFPTAVSRICCEYAEHFRDIDVDLVAGPAIGGVLLAQWTTHWLQNFNNSEDKPLAIFAENGPDGFKIFKRGYNKMIPGKKVLVVEDVTTTGGSIEEVIRAVQEAGGEVIGVAVLCNRSKGDNLITAESLGVPELFSLLEIPLDAWPEDECPLCKKGVPINTELGKGSQYLQKKGKI